MLALLDTIQRERAGRSSKASPEAARSYQHQMSAQSIAGASHGGRPGQALVADYQPQDWPILPGRAGFVGFDAPTNGRGLRASGYRISHRPGFSSLTGRLVAECAFASAPVITNSLDHGGANRQVVHSIAHQHFNKHFADALHVQTVPSSNAFIRWFQTYREGFCRWTKSVCRTVKK